MSSASQRSATAAASLAIDSLSVRSSGAMVAVPPASWMRSSTVLERAGGAGHQDDVGAGRGERFGGRGADAAAGAGDERKLAGEEAWHSAMDVECD